MNRRQQIEAGTREFNDKNNCAVRAVCVVTGLDYAIVHEAYRKRGRKNRCGAQTYTTLEVLKDLGFKAEEIPFKAKTIRTLQQSRELPLFGMFIVRTTRHLTGVADRAYIDWATTTCKRVRQVWKVTRARQS